jgi:hypothetical protein
MRTLYYLHWRLQYWFMCLFVFSLTNLFIRFELDRGFLLKLSKYLHLVTVRFSVKTSFPIRFLCEGKTRFSFMWCKYQKRESVTPLLRFLYHKIIHTHTQPVDLLCTTDQLVAEATTYTTHNKQARSARFEPTIRPIRPMQTCILDRMASAIVLLFCLIANIQLRGWFCSKNSVISQLY